MVNDEKQLENGGGGVPVAPLQHDYEAFPPNHGRLHQQNGTGSREKDGARAAKIKTGIIRPSRDTAGFVTGRHQ